MTDFDNSPYADSAQARAGDKKREAPAVAHNENGELFAKKCEETRIADAQAFKPRLKSALDQMEKFFNVGSKETKPGDDNAQASGR